MHGGSAESLDPVPWIEGLSPQQHIFWAESPTEVKGRLQNPHHLRITKPVYAKLFAITLGQLNFWAL
jgi:hypothetical protein